MFSDVTDLTNIEYNSVDVCPGLKTEILDLNFDTIPDHMRGHYDVVFNFGTTEHIFNQWNCFEFMHDALKVGGVVYHQLPASGYLDHGYYCYTPLFFREMAQANHYAVEHLSVTQDNRVPSLNVHVILRKAVDAPFKASLEIATAHSAVNGKMLERYNKGGGRAALPSSDPSGIIMRY